MLMEMPARLVCDMFSCLLMFTHSQAQACEMCVCGWSAKLISICRLPTIFGENDMLNGAAAAEMPKIKY